MRASLCTHDKWCPFPEEINCDVAGGVADLHLATIERVCQEPPTRTEDPYHFALVPGIDHWQREKDGLGFCHRAITEFCVEEGA